MRGKKSLLYLLTHLIFLGLFIFFMYIWVSISCHFPSAWGNSFYNFLQCYSIGNELSQLLLSKMSLFYSTFKESFHYIQNSRLAGFVCLFVCFLEIHVLFIYLFIYLWLYWVFVSVRGLSLVAASGGHSSSRCTGLSLSRPLLSRNTGSRCAGSVIVAHGPSCSAARGILPDQGSNPCSLHWQADSQPLRHQGSPAGFFSF